MPEGFASVADMRVIVDANADKFHSGVKGILQALGELDQNGNKTLTGLDQMLLAVGDVSLTATGKFKALAAGVEAGIALYQKLAVEGRAVAEALGVTDEYDRLKSAIDDLGMSLMDSAVGAFFAVKAAGMDTASAMFGFADATAVGDENAKSFASTLIDSVTGAIDSVRLNLRLLNADLATNAREIDTTIGLLDRQIAEVRERLRAMQAGETASQLTVQARGGSSVIDLEVRAQRELNELIERRNELLEKRSILPGQDWVDGTQVHVSLLGQEIQSLEQRNATLGMSAAAAAEYTALQRAMADAQRQGIALTDEAIAQMQREAAQIRELTAYSEAYRKAKAEEDRQKQLGEQRERSEGQIFANAERELATLRARAEAMGLNAAAAAELVMYERLLQQFRASGVTIDDALIVKIRAIAAEYGKTTAVVAEQQAELRELGEVGQSIAGGLSSAFARWTQGAKLDVKDMVASILADLAQLTLRRSVLEPLFGGGSGGGAGLFGDLMASVFGGFRADGGDVETGRAYVVGERGPEWFMPREPGSILPNGTAPAGRAGGEVHVYVHGTPEFEARVVSTAEGVVAQRAPAIVGQAVEATQAVRDAYGMDGPWR